MITDRSKRPSTPSSRRISFADIGREKEVSVEKKDAPKKGDLIYNWPGMASCMQQVLPISVVFLNHEKKNSYAHVQCTIQVCQNYRRLGKSIFSLIPRPSSLCLQEKNKGEEGLV